MRRPNTITVDPLAGLLRYYDFTTKKLAEVWHCDERTARRKVKMPEKITVLELRQLIRAGVPREKIGEVFR